MKSLIHILVIGLTISAVATYADDWPHFLGPDNNNISKETGLLKKWPISGPKELWSLTLGEGFGGASVRDGEVYILDRINNEKDVLRCIDLETGEIIEEPGRKGKMIITALDRIAQPCVRFDSKDVIEWDPDPCTCGRTFRLIRGGVIGRSDDITKVKGVLLSPAAIEEVVRSIDGLGDEFEIVVDKQGDVDRIKLKVELMPEATKLGVEPLLKDQLRLKTNLGYQIEYYDYGSLPRYEVKAKRFKDLRKKHIIEKECRL